MRHLINVLGFMFFVTVFAFAVAGCSTGTIHTMQRPTTLSSDSSLRDTTAASLADEMDSACDTYRARRTSPQHLSDGTPIYCF